MAQVTDTGSRLRLDIGEGRDIHISLDMAAQGSSDWAFNVSGKTSGSSPAAHEDTLQEKVVRTLDRKYFSIGDVVLGAETSIHDGILTIREDLIGEIRENTENIVDFALTIIHPDEMHQYSATIMDVQPIATKHGEDMLGTGQTIVLDGVVLMLTGVTEEGVPVGEFGSSEGYLDENIILGRPGCPDEGEILIKVQGVIPAGKNMERPGPFAIHEAANKVAEEIRKCMKQLDPADADRTEHLEQISGRKHKIVIVKEIMGQGAMHDHIILPNEPVGIMGGVSNIDLGNLPVNMSPLEVLDGAVHSMTCVGPGSKEVSRHFFREPLIQMALEEEDFEVLGVVIIGSSQINTEKYYSSRRLGMMLEAIRPDGVIITTEGFGNNHIDFASHHEQAGIRGIPAVGCSFCANQGALVVGSEYMTNMIELNKSYMGVENEIMAINTLCPEDAVRALTMMKSVLEGRKVAGPERKWEQDVITDNQQTIDEAGGFHTDRVPDESSIPLSDKRIRKYGLSRDQEGE